MAQQQHPLVVYVLVDHSRRWSDQGAAWLADYQDKLRKFSKANFQQKVNLKFGEIVQVPVNPGAMQSVMVNAVRQSALTEQLQPIVEYAHQYQDVPIQLHALLMSDPAPGWEPLTSELSSLSWVQRVVFYALPEMSEAALETLRAGQNQGFFKLREFQDFSEDSIRKTHNYIYNAIQRYFENYTSDSEVAESSDDPENQEHSTIREVAPSAGESNIPDESPDAYNEQKRELPEGYSKLRYQPEDQGPDVEVEPVHEPEPIHIPIDESGAATNWEVREPEDESDPVPHTLVDSLYTSDGWFMAGASRRGKMHAHKGLYREDAFALGEEAGWHVMVVADGGGSNPLARVGSKIAADAGVDGMKRWLRKMIDADMTDAELAKIALQKAVEEAWRAIEQQAEQRAVPIKQFGTTFLSVMHKQREESTTIGVLQVGDGMIAALMHNNTPWPITVPDVGEAASETVFLTSGPAKVWLDRAVAYEVTTVEQQPIMLVAMCDGVGDDLIPVEENLPGLFERLKGYVQQDSPEVRILEWLDYQRRGSFDDRTVTLICDPRLMNARGG